MFSASLSPEAYAVIVECNAGGLAEAVKATVADPAAETSLTVKGQLDASDFDYLRELTALRTLDLSQATVAAYSGDATDTGITESKANVLPSCAFLSGQYTSLALPQGITEISEGSFGGSKIETLTIPSTVTIIGEGAFSGMADLQSVTIPSSVTSMGSMAFKDCPKLTDVVINARIDSLPAKTFTNDAALRSVTLPATLKSIGASAFAGCKDLKSIVIPSTVTTIGDMAFADTGLTSVDLSSNSLKSVGDWAFSGCTDLKTVTVGSSLTSIGKGAFYNNTSLSAELGEIAANLTEIPDYMVYGASSVTSERLGETNVESIGAYALSGLRDESVALPSNLSYMGDNAMERWTNLTLIDAKSIEQVPELGSSVWEDTPQSETVLYVPAELLTQFKDAPQWQEFDVKSQTTSSAEIADENPSNIKALFDGTLLMVEAACDIRAVQLYDITGRCFTIARNYEGNRLAVDTAPFDTRVFIVRILLSDGTTPVLKLFR